MAEERDSGIVVEEIVTLTANQIRSRLERIHTSMLDLEKEMEIFYGRSKGVNASLIEVRHEITEATEGIERAINCIDANYRALL